MQAILSSVFICGEHTTHINYFSYDKNYPAFRQSVPHELNDEVIPNK